GGVRSAAAGECDGDLVDAGRARAGCLGLTRWSNVLGRRAQVASTRPTAFTAVLMENPGEIHPSPRTLDGPSGVAAPYGRVRQTASACGSSASLAAPSP